MSSSLCADDDGRPRRLVGVATIAQWLGVKPNTVYKYIDRGADPDDDWPEFPKPDYATPTARADLVFLSWEPSREREIRAYKEKLEQRPGKGWRFGQTGDIRYTTHQHVGKRPERTRKGST